MNPFLVNPLHLLAGLAVASVVGFGGGWTANGWRLGAELSDIKTVHAQQVAKAAGEAVTTMKADAVAIHTAAEEFATLQSTLGPKFDALKNEVRNAKAATPLPTGCLPDDARVRNLNAAIDAANAAAAGR
ncbi:MAG: hypothetical protein V4684_19500 [Pseudomonadota bacterium]